MSHNLMMVTCLKTTTINTDNNNNFYASLVTRSTSSYFVIHWLRMNRKNVDSSQPMTSFVIFYVCQLKLTENGETTHTEQEP